MGRVIWAKAVSGHPQLRQAAEGAAWQTKFSPTILSDSQSELQASCFITSCLKLIQLSATGA
jgi:hypothetical protein